MNIGGNKKAIIQVYGITKNSIGEDAREWADALSLEGWLDLQTGDSGSVDFHTKIQESTHIFLCDYRPLSAGGTKITPENSRMIIDGEVYEVKLYDDPMNLHEHLEIFLKFMGG